MKKYNIKAVQGDNFAVLDTTPTLALQRALSNYSAIASMPSIMKLRSEASTGDYLNTNVLRTNTEVIVGKIEDQQRVIILHGGGFLHTAEELSDAIFHQMPNGAAPIHEEFYDILINNKRLPDGTNIEIYNFSEVIQETRRGSKLDEPYAIALYKDEIEAINSNNESSYTRLDLETVLRELQLFEKTNSSHMRAIPNKRPELFIAMCGGSNNAQEYITYLLEHKNRTFTTDQRFIYTHPFNAEYFSNNQTPHIRATFLRPPMLGFDVASNLNRNAAYIALSTISTENLPAIDNVATRTERRPKCTDLIGLLQKNVSPEHRKEFEDSLGLNRTSRAPPLDEILKKGMTIITDPKLWIETEQKIKETYAAALHSKVEQEQIMIQTIPTALYGMFDTYLVENDAVAMKNAVDKIGRIPTMEEFEDLIKMTVPEDRASLVRGAFKNMISHSRR